MKCQQNVRKIKEESLTKEHFHIPTGPALYLIYKLGIVSFENFVIVNRKLYMKIETERVNTSIIPSRALQGLSLRNFLKIQRKAPKEPSDSE